MLLSCVYQVECVLLVTDQGRRMIPLGDREDENATCEPHLGEGMHAAHLHLDQDMLSSLASHRANDE